MFDSITHEAMPNGDTLAHFHASDIDLFGYVAFRHTSRRLAIRATLFHVGVMRTLSASYIHRSAEAWAQDFTEPYV